MQQSGKHLDLGCGNKARNPYGYNEVFGVDIYESEQLADALHFKHANLSIDKIPFPDNFFDSVSAFDVIEHIPRILPNQTGGTRFPFIELMDEIWRVLKPGGLFYAHTPAYPASEAFQDPTHVNIITDKTHLYFCEKKLYANNYGFKGRFRDKLVKKVNAKHRTNFGMTGILKQMYNIKFILKGRKTHLLWELEAIK